MLTTYWFIGSKMYKRKEIIGDCTLYLGDCMDIMPLLEKVDAVVTDPPYGINYSANKSNLPNSKNFEVLKNDDIEIDLSMLFYIDCPKIVFGAYNLYKQLPHKGRMFLWDKRVIESADKMLGSPYETAWEDRKTGYDRIYRLQHGGVINADKIGERRVHPTQKPIKLMKHILTLKPYIDCETILDPFMGSGTTGVACVKMGRKFIGIELDEGYFNIACQRIRDAYAQPDMLLDAGL